jgi:hypothetical protein
VIAPLLKDVTDIAGKVGKNPQLYTDQVNALINAAPVGVEAGIQAGKNAAATKIGEANGLIKAGVAQADALATAGIKTTPTAALNADQMATLESGMRGQYTARPRTSRGARRVPAGAGRDRHADRRHGADLRVHEDARPELGRARGRVRDRPERAGRPRADPEPLQPAADRRETQRRQRSDIRDQAAKFYTPRRSSSSSPSDQFRGSPSAPGLNPDNVVVDQTAAPGTTAVTAASGSATPAPARPDVSTGGEGPPAHFMAGPQRRYLEVHVAGGSRAVELTTDQARAVAIARAARGAAGPQRDHHPRQRSCPSA